MKTSGKNPFELGAAADHLGTAASALRDSIDDLRRLDVSPSVLGMLTDAMTLCGNLAQQIDSATGIELARVNALPDEPVEDILRDLAGGSVKNMSQSCPSCLGVGAINVHHGSTATLARCTTCDGRWIA